MPHAGVDQHVIAIDCEDHVLIGSGTFVGPTGLWASLEHLEALIEPVDASLHVVRNQGWYALQLEDSFSNFRPET